MTTTTCVYDALTHKQTLWLLELQIASLPDVPKKILAPYYFEKAPLSQIAACFGLPESEITRIRAKTVAALRKEFYGTLSSEERRTALRERICSSLLPF